MTRPGAGKGKIREFPAKKGSSSESGSGPENQGHSRPRHRRGDTLLTVTAPTGQVVSSAPVEVKPESGATFVPGTTIPIPEAYSQGSAQQPQQQPRAAQPAQSTAAGRSHRGSLKATVPGTPGAANTGRSIYSRRSYRSNEDSVFGGTALPSFRSESESPKASARSDDDTTPLALPAHSRNPSQQQSRPQDVPSLAGPKMERAKAAASDGKQESASAAAHPSPPPDLFVSPRGSYRSRSRMSYRSSRASGAINSPVQTPLPQKQRPFGFPKKAATAPVESEEKRVARWRAECAARQELMLQMEPLEFKSDEASRNAYDAMFEQLIKMRSDHLQKIALHERSAYEKFIENEKNELGLVGFEFDHRAHEPDEEAALEDFDRQLDGFDEQDRLKEIKELQAVSEIRTNFFQKLDQFNPANYQALLDFFQSVYKSYRADPAKMELAAKQLDIIVNRQLAFFIDQFDEFVARQLATFNKAENKQPNFEQIALAAYQHVSERIDKEPRGLNGFDIRSIKRIINHLKMSLVLEEWNEVTKVVSQTVPVQSTQTPQPAPPLSAQRPAQPQPSAMTSAEEKTMVMVENVFKVKLDSPDLATIKNETERFRTAALELTRRAFVGLVEKNDNQENLQKLAAFDLFSKNIDRQNAIIREKLGLQMAVQAPGSATVTESKRSAREQRDQTAAGGVQPATSASVGNTAALGPVAPSPVDRTVQPHPGPLAPQPAVSAPLAAPPSNAQGLAQAQPSATTSAAPKPEYLKRIKNIYAKKLKEIHKKNPAAENSELQAIQHMQAGIEQFKRQRLESKTTVWQRFKDTFIYKEDDIEELEKAFKHFVREKFRALGESVSKFGQDYLEPQDENKLPDVAASVSTSRESRVVLRAGAEDHEGDYEESQAEQSQQESPHTPKAAVPPVPDPAKAAEVRERVPGLNPARRAATEANLLSPVTVPRRLTPLGIAADQGSSNAARVLVGAQNELTRQLAEAKAVIELNRTIIEDLQQRNTVLEHEVRSLRQQLQAQTPILPSSAQRRPRPASAPSTERKADPRVVDVGGTLTPRREPSGQPIPTVQSGPKVDAAHLPGVMPGSNSDNGSAPGIEQNQRREDLEGKRVVRRVLPTTQLGAVQGGTPAEPTQGPLVGSNNSVILQGRAKRPAQQQPGPDASQEPPPGGERHHPSPLAAQPNPQQAEPPSAVRKADASVAELEEELEQVRREKAEAEAGNAGKDKRDDKPRPSRCTIQ